MTAIPLSILALAAGVYLLVKVKREFLGTAFELLAWLIIVLSLVAIGFTGYRVAKNMTCGNCKGKQQCHIEKNIEVTETMGHGCPHAMEMDAPHGACCKAEGDSMVMDKAMCKKMMGKEACEAMCKERGRCIMSKEECAAHCKAETKGCCAKKEAAAGCPMHQAGCKGDCAGKCSGQCDKKCDAEKKACCSKP